MPLRIGIIGFGTHGQFLFDAARRIGNIEVRAICRRNVEATQDAAQRLGVKGVVDYHEILDDPQIEAVFITSPAHVHHEHCLAALRAGKHVLLEKPLADTPAHCRAIVEAAEQSSCVVMVDHCERFNPAFIDAKRVIRTGRLGELRVVSSTRLSPLHLNSPQWPMGVLDTAVHNLDLICWMFEALPTRLCARSARVTPNLLIDDNVWVSLEFEGGRRAEDHIAWVPMERYLMPVAHPRFLLQGTSGFYQVDLWRRSGILYDGDYSKYTDDVLLGLSEEYLSTMAYGLWYFVQAISRGGPSPMPPRKALPAVNIALTACRSLAQGGAWIPVEAGD